MSESRHSSLPIEAPAEHAPDERAASDVPQAMAASACTHDRLILVAEDDRINQKVILRQLAQLGHAAEVAGNGVLALHLWHSGRFALLMTDLHMPEMDGCALTAAIRNEERHGGRGRVPIVALTANALGGEANGALAAGVDEYLTKPVSLRVLRDMLERRLPPPAPPSSTSSRSSTTSPASSSAAALDIRVLQELAGGDAAMLRDLLTEYLICAREAAAVMRMALAADDAPGVGASMHRLKSSSRSVGALALGESCAELESAGEAGDVSAASQAIGAFELRFAAMEASIHAQLTASLATANPGSTGK